ncbi:hypothetical protein PsorP6_007654 [Peronosclerospora sorghi]|uniref:Uncharacterized protein n=1 Tax=Peronosclerospora sorghi TaxID=230839 RepID=A0ACC0WBN9_9STRA|nr:hypothetical protein PsorP6_007654 [Peronosclerospora sorghi]
MDLSGNPLFPMDSQVWLNSLRDPQTIALRDAVALATPDQDSRGHCVLSSSTELYLSPSETSTRLHGFGVAWTLKKHAMLWERNETNLGIAVAVLTELVLNDLVNSRTTTEALISFLRGFNDQLRSLELRRNSLSSMDLDAILAGCEQLHNLDIEGCRVIQLQLLVDALCGALGQNLRKLNLNANLVGADSVNVLTVVLCGQVGDRILVLEELRLALNMIGANGVSHLHRALKANKKLILLELDLPSESVEASRQPGDEEYIQLYRSRCKRLDMMFQNEVLGMTPLLLGRKLAFLLVLSALDVVLDRGMCTTIFSFAADKKRRRLVWKITHDP